MMMLCIQEMQDGRLVTFGSSDIAGAATGATLIAAPKVTLVDLAGVVEAARAAPLPAARAVEPTDRTAMMPMVAMIRLMKSCGPSRKGMSLSLLPSCAPMRERAMTESSLLN